MPVLCEMCGQEIKGIRPIVRKLNHRNHYCCCLRCEVKWEKENLVGICG